MLVHGWRKRGRRKVRPQWVAPPFQLDVVLLNSLVVVIADSFVADQVDLLGSG